MTHCTLPARGLGAQEAGVRNPHASGLPDCFPGAHQGGSSLVEVLAALAITAAVMAAAAGISQRVGTAMTTSAGRNRQVKALFYAATEVRRTGTASPVVEGYPVSVSRRAAVWGSDAVLVYRTPNSSCQGDCNPDPQSVVGSSSVFTVTVGTVSPQERPVSLLAFTTVQQ